MRFEICLDCERDIRLPIYYNSSVRDMIYDNISPELHRQFCDKECLYENKRFDLFTFSRLKGKSKVNSYNEEIVFTPPIEIILSSPIEEFLNELGYLMLICDDVYLGENQLKMTRFRIIEKPNISSLELIYMVSPIIVCDTIAENFEDSMTHYYSPNDKEFSEVIEKDLRKKFFKIHNCEPREFQNINISPVKVEEKIFRYNSDIEIRSWIGIFILEGDPELINIGYEAGIGCMNSFGFGCFGFVKGERRLPYCRC